MIEASTLSHDSMSSAIEKALKGLLGVDDFATMKHADLPTTELVCRWNLRSLERVVGDQRKLIEHVGDILHEISSRITWGEIGKMRGTIEARDKEIEGLKKRVEDLERYRTFYEMGRGC